MSEIVASFDLRSQTPESGIREGIALISSIILEPQYVATGEAREWAETAQGLRATKLYVLKAFLRLGEGYLYDATRLHAYAEGYSGMYLVERVDS